MRRFLTLAREDKGIAIVEFAICAPILVTLYLGSYQLMDAVGCYRKVTTTTRALADLTSQYTSVSDEDLDTVLNASKQIMLPYDSAKGTYRVSLVTVDNSGNAKVAWSRSLPSGGALTTGATYALPANVKKNGMSYVISDVTFAYAPVAGKDMIGNIPLKDQIYMMPRGSATITRKT